MILSWKTRNLMATDYEFAQHVQTQLANEKENLLRLKVSGSEIDSPIKQSIAEEKIVVLEELIKPLRNSVLVEPDTIYTPTCIGVISKWPWYDLLHDWLCLVGKHIKEADFDRFPFERYSYLIQLCYQFNT